MRTKVSEKGLAIAVIAFVSSIVLFFSLSLFALPVRMSEKGLMYVIIAFALIIVSLISFKRSIAKQ